VPSVLLFLKFSDAYSFQKKRYGRKEVYDMFYSHREKEVFFIPFHGPAKKTLTIPSGLSGVFRYNIG
jgi:hypothetical protein